MDHAEIIRMQNMVSDMQLLMDTLLTIARQGSTTLPVNAVNLTDVMHNICSNLQSMFTAQSMQYDIQQVTANIPTTNAPVVAMIFGNIIRNAIHYSQGKSVSILIDAHRIVIEDDGVGLPLDAITALHQLDQDYDRVIPHQGYGIGLKLVKRLCNMIGWEIELINKSNLKPSQFPSKNAEGLAVVIYTS